jgi:hypothetical protein
MRRGMHSRAVDSVDGVLVRTVDIDDRVDAKYSNPGRGKEFDFAQVDDDPVR